MEAEFVLCIVARNGATCREEEMSKPLFFAPDLPFSKFLELCSSKVGIQGKRLFDIQGTEITDVSTIKPDDHIIVSDGDEFVPTSDCRKPTAARDSVVMPRYSLDTSTMVRCYFAVIGPAAVGKSALSLRYTRNYFDSDYIPTAEDCYQRFLMVDSVKTEVNILDTAGLEDFISMRQHWISNKDGLVLVYSADKRSSFQGIEAFYNEVAYIYPQADIPIVLVANKIDLPQEVSRAEGLAMAKKLNAQYFETSAKSGENVQELFGYLIRKTVARRLNGKVGINGSVDQTDDQRTKPFKGMCQTCQIF